MALSINGASVSQAQMVAANPIQQRVEQDTRPRDDQQQVRQNQDTQNTGAVQKTAQGNDNGQITARAANERTDAPMDSNQPRGSYLDISV